MCVNDEMMSIALCPKSRPDLDSACLLLDHIDGFEAFILFKVLISSYLPLLHKVSPTEYPALGTLHEHLWKELPANLYQFVVTSPVPYLG